MIIKLKLLLKIAISMVFILSILVSAVLFAPLIFDLKPYRITSTSMKPFFNKGDIIYIKPVKSEDLLANDIIAFYLPNSNVIVTHRIVKIDITKKQVLTKGDNNRNQDPQQIAYSDIIGKYADYKIPRLW